jgi:hypothetical protein
MRSVTIICENPDCQKSFTAARVDARFCSARCRQANHRRNKHPIARSAGVGRGQHLHSQIESVRTVIRGQQDRVKQLIGAVDVGEVIEAPDAPLADWDRELTETIRALSQIRRGIRNRLATRGPQDYLPGKG